MSTIRLEKVTKAFTPPTTPLLKSGRNVEEIESVSTALQADGSLLALNDVSLTIPDGKTLVIVGPSGCGKSTLLRVVSGLESNYSGRVFYDDTVMDELPPKDRHIGMVFQNYALYPHMEGQGNLSFFFRIRRATDAETEERIRITSEIMGIGFKQLLVRKPGTLSGGQQQRLAIARAIVRNPQLFLFDEPLSNLDAKLRTQTRIEIKRLLRRFEITAIYVTHDQVEAMALGDLVAVMRSGRVEQMGSFQALMQDPDNAFVAGFLGMPPMNIFQDAHVEGDHLRLGEGSMPLPDEWAAKVYSGQRLTIGVRPEAGMIVDENGSAGQGLRLSGEVQGIEPDFARQNRLIYLADGERAYGVQGPLDAPLNVGNRLEVYFPQEALFYFDGDSGQRLR